MIYLLLSFLSFFIILSFCLFFYLLLFLASLYLSLFSLSLSISIFRSSLFYLFFSIYILHVFCTFIRTLSLYFDLQILTKNRCTLLQAQQILSKFISFFWKLSFFILFTFNEQSFSIDNFSIKLTESDKSIAIISLSYFFSFSPIIFYHSLPFLSLSFSRISLSFSLL